MVEPHRLECLGGWLNPFDGLGEPVELKPQIVGRDIMIPVPVLARPGGSDEEWGKDNIMQNDAGLVLLIQLERTGVARLNGAAFGQQNRPARLEVLYFPYRIGRHDVHRPFADIQRSAEVQIPVHVREIVIGHQADPAISRAFAVVVEAAQTLRDEIFRKELFELREHLLRPFHIPLASNRIHFIPEFPCENDRIVPVPVCIPLELCLELLAAGPALEKIVDILGRPALRDMMERLGRPLLPRSEEMTKVLDRHLDTHVVPAGHLKHGIDAFGFFRIILAAAFVFYVEKVVAEPQTNVVATILGETFDPLVHASEGFSFIRTSRSDHIQSDWNERLAVRQLEISVVTCANAYEGPALMQATSCMRCGTNRYCKADDQTQNDFFHVLTLHVINLIISVKYNLNPLIKIELQVFCYFFRFSVTKFCHRRL